ncbi:unnamed protein product [Bubo scandiacus]
MEPLRLVPLLASLQILLPLAALTDPPPPPPNITVTPEKTEYLLGDTVTLRCVAPWSKEKLQGFQFLGTSGWAVDARTTKRSYTYRFNLTRPQDGGSHACAYTLINRYRQPRSLPPEQTHHHQRQSRIPLNSPPEFTKLAKKKLESTPKTPRLRVLLHLSDHPPQPTLTLTPSGGVTVEGQALVFVCAAPAGDGERRFNFYKDEVKVTDGVELTLNNTEAQLRVAAGGRNHTGNFSCGYEEETEGRWIPSYLSQPIDVLVKERASPPQLSVDPPSGVVSEDYPLQLTCAASRDDFELKFRFYRNGVQIPPGQTGAKMRNDGNFSQLFFPKSPRNFGGKFSCGVEEEMGGTWVPSPLSETVDVTIKERSQLLPLAAGGVAGGVMLLLGLLLAVCLCRRRRGGAHWKGFKNKDDPSTYPMAYVDGGDP